MKAGILVVEDSAPQAFALRVLLEKHGYRVVIAENGKKALELLQRQSFQMVISDIDMPEMNGFDLSLSIKRDPTLHTIPVILLTGLSKTEDILQGLNARADFYLTKPFDPDYLLDRVKTLLKSPAMPAMDTEDAGLTITVEGQDHVVTASRQHMLNLLLSTYEGAVRQNRELVKAQVELKQRNQQLREQGHRLKASERNFRALLESDIEGIVVVDQKGLVKFVNPAAQMLFKKSSSELLDKPFQFALVTDETREVRIPFPEHDEVIAELHVADTVWEGELASLASIRDVTQRKRNAEKLIKAQAALKERNQKLHEQGQRLRVSERNSRALLENNADGIAVIDQKTMVRYLNPAAEILLGRSADELLNQPFGYQLTPDEPSEIEISSPDVETIIAELHVVDTVWESEPAFLASLRDITQKKKDEQQLINAQQTLRERNQTLREQGHRLRISERNFRALLENSADGMIVVDSHGAVRFVNPSAEILLACSAKMLISKPFEYSVVPDETVEIEIRSSDGQTTIAELHGVDTVWEGEGAFLASIRDITQRTKDENKIREQQAQLEEANAQLQALATTDGLTGLKNHRTFKERVHEEFQRAIRFELPLSLILLDVDHFKQFNDAFGHPAGDEVLKQVAKLLEENARTTDLVARYGGEEFVVILPYTDPKQTMDMAERMRQIIASAEWDHRNITASFGASSTTPNMGDVMELISEADIALYSSKQNGRNRVSHAHDSHGETE